MSQQAGQGPRIGNKKGGAPPVTKTGMPARCASSMVADTVVAPSRRLATTYARSRRDVLRARSPLEGHSTLALTLPIISQPWP